MKIITEQFERKKLKVESFVMIQIRNFFVLDLNIKSHPQSG